MTKKEILQSVAFAPVPDGAMLVEREVNRAGLTVADMCVGNGIPVITARMLLERLTHDTERFADKPEPALFRGVHESALRFNQLILEATTFPAVEDITIAEHRLMIARLQEIAHQLGITYEPPADPLLEGGESYE